MKIRTATLNDLDALTAVEAECFPAAEAATKKDFENRLAYYADHFWLMFDENDKLIAFVDGMVTDQADLTDEMYEKGELHNENGASVSYTHLDVYKRQLLFIMILNLS